MVIGDGVVRIHAPLHGREAENGQRGDAGSKEDEHVHGLLGLRSVMLEASQTYMPSPVRNRPSTPSCNLAVPDSTTNERGPSTYAW
jgi:hypothetical protein